MYAKDVNGTAVLYAKFFPELVRCEWDVPCGNVCTWIALCYILD